jgi:hypothetical protein
MKTIHGMALAASFVLLVGGCAGVQWDQRVSVAAPPDGGREAGAAVATVPVSGSTNADPQRHGFAILHFRAVRDRYEQVCVLGEIKNIGSAARGVELQASLRDARGHVVAVGHFVPASHRNIVPNEAWPFTYSFGRQEEAVTAELRIVGAFRTMDILNVASTTP